MNSNRSIYPRQNIIAIITIIWVMVICFSLYSLSHVVLNVFANEGLRRGDVFFICFMDLLAQELNYEDFGSFFFFLNWLGCWARYMGFLIMFIRFLGTFWRLRFISWRFFFSFWLWAGWFLKYLMRYMISSFA